MSFLQQVAARAQGTERVVRLRGPSLFEDDGLAPVLARTVPAAYEPRLPGTRAPGGEGVEPRATTDRAAPAAVDVVVGEPTAGPFRAPRPRPATAPDAGPAPVPPEPVGPVAAGERDAPGAAPRGPSIRPPDAADRGAAVRGAEGPPPSPPATGPGARPADPELPGVPDLEDSRAPTVVVEVTAPVEPPGPGDELSGLPRQELPPTGVAEGHRSVADLVRSEVVPALVARGVVAPDERLEVRPAEAAAVPRRRVPPRDARDTAISTTPASTATGDGAVHVHIDRVDVVRAAPAAPAAPAPRARRVDHTGYLAERRRRDGR